MSSSLWRTSRERPCPSQDVKSHCSTGPRTLFADRAAAVAVAKGVGWAERATAVIAADGAWRHAAKVAVNGVVFGADVRAGEEVGVEAFRV